MGSIVFKSRLTSHQETDGQLLSVVIITLNEYDNLRVLLPKIPPGSEIIIVDSGSTDQTKNICESVGASFFVRKFDNYASQKNYALSLATRPWTIMLDADERPDHRLWTSILKVVTKDPPDTAVAFKVNRKLVFLGRPLKFGRTSDQITRLIPSKTALFEKEIHETLKLPRNAQINSLEGVLWHWSYKSLSEYFYRFNLYTDTMAQTKHKNQKRAPHPIWLAVRLPLDFGVRYFFRLGFLDGWYGFLWALLGAYYSFVKYAKLRELNERLASSLKPLE